jgi:protein-S-isoprenylcysteine O-methyltransferase Ste14
MRKLGAAVGSAIFLVVAPGVVVGLLPWLFTRWQVRSLPDGWSWLGLPAWALGGGLILAGVTTILGAFARFVTEGLGTPAPVAPPQRLVVGGQYRFVRNPMYVALFWCVIGQALVLHQPVLVWYALACLAATFTFVKLYEEPHLSRAFGEDYARYRRHVPGWWPRLRPWNPDTDG